MIRQATTQEASNYVEFIYKLYAEQAALGFVLPKQKAEEVAIAILDGLLPQKHETPDNYFYIIEEENKNIGGIWLSLNQEFDKKIGFLRYIFIEDEFRGKGFAKKAIQDLEVIIKDKFLCGRFQLNVFGFNKGAIKLYQELGFTEQRITMIKDL